MPASMGTELPECPGDRALVGPRREDNPFFLYFHRNLDTFSGLTGPLCLVNPCKETIPCGFKVSQSKASGVFASCGEYSLPETSKKI